MSIMKGLLAKLRRSRDQPKGSVSEGLQPLQAEALIQAHGDWLALLATILEREHVISGTELARSLSEFAALTAEDRPAEGRILAFWASRLQDTAVSLRDFPSVH